jgi:hypothetical protein
MPCIHRYSESIIPRLFKSLDMCAILIIVFLNILYPKAIYTPSESVPSYMYLRVRAEDRIRQYNMYLHVVLNYMYLFHSFST